jgi:stage IV sporulation protein FB
MADSPEKGRKAAVRGASQAWSLHLATVAGVPIRLHATFLILLAWFAMIAIRAPGPDRWNRFVFVAALFACVVLHELGHAVAARRFGIRTLDIVLYPIGGVARLERAPRA